MVSEIETRYPEVLGHLGAKDHDGFLRKLSEIKRLHAIAQTMGWIGVLLSRWFSVHKVTRDLNEREFQRFVELYVEKREWLEDKLQLHWPDGVEFVLKRFKRAPP